MTAAGSASNDVAVRARIFEEMSDAILIADDARRYVDVNDAACTLLGRTREELLSLRIDDIMPSGGADVDGLWRSFLAEGTQRGELVLPRGKDRIVVDYRARARIAPGRHLTVMRDITSRVAASEGAENARAILDSLLMTAPIGFAYLDRDLRFRLVNPCLASINGLSVEAHIGRTPMEILPGLAAEFIRTHADAVFTTGQPQTNLELQGETPAEPGVRRTWIEQWYPVRVGGEIIGVGIVVEEVTEKRRAEEQLREAVELRERLMAIVSHDLRNPLSAITTAATIINMEAESPRRVVSMASRVLTSTKRMSDLIEQLLDFVRVDQAGGLAVDRVPMDLASAAAKAIDECGLAFPNASFDVEAKGNTAGRWDEDRILQVVANLVSNAVQHGDGRVHVCFDGTDPEAVRVEIENAGTQIPEELLPVIFDPFRRANDGYARRTGLGLGLFISKSIVESHGGDIGVRSDERGTTFHFTLPRR